MNYGGDSKNPTMKQDLSGLWVVRLYDGFDNEWMDITEPISREEAEKIWNERTENGTKNTGYGDIDYYAIYPEDTKMFFSSENVNARLIKETQ